jgi:hypothetical protein
MIVFSDINIIIKINKIIAQDLAKGDKGSQN